MINVVRDYDATRINEIVNTPGIYEWVHGVIVGKLDLTDLLKNPRNVCLIGEQGGILFTCLQPGLYDAHVSILEDGRRAWGLEFVQTCLHYMFCCTDAVELFSRVPRGNIAAKALVKCIGGKYEFTRPDSWVKDHKPIDSDIYSLKIQDWTRDVDFGLEGTGKWFHCELSRQYLELGKLDDQHDEDENHDRYVGAAVEMMLGGQPYKAAVLYNRWASVAGYEAISIVSSKPLLVNIQESLILVADGKFKVIQCL